MVRAGLKNLIKRSLDKESQEMLWKCAAILALILEEMVVSSVFYCCLTNEPRFSCLQDWLGSLRRLKWKCGLDWVLISRVWGKNPLLRSFMLLAEFTCWDCRTEVPPFLAGWWLDSSLWAFHVVLSIFKASKSFKRLKSLWLLLPPTREYSLLLEFIGLD